MARVALGCMRLLPEDAEATIAAALDAGADWLDTARAYGESERLVGRVVARRPARIITKCGMTNPGWVPDGRAGAIIADARASVAVLGRAPDLLLLHAPDPRVGLRTSVRALVRARDEGLAQAIGLSNVSRRQLDELDSEIAAVEVALGLGDDSAVRGGVLAWCREHGVPLFAHSPLGGPKKAKRLLRDPAFASVALRHPGATPAMIAIAYLLTLDAVVVPVVGARRPEAARQAIAAGSIALEGADLELLDRRFVGLALARRSGRTAVTGDAEVVLVMGLAGAGKTRLAERYVADGYLRLNRDTLGGTLNGIARRLSEALANGACRVVLDNTYLTRRARSEVVRVAHAANARVRCVHVATTPGDAQVNLTTRMLDAHGELLGGAELARRAKHDEGLFAPTTLFRMERQLECPALDEGFATIDTVPFVRTPVEGRAAVALPLDRIFDERGPSLRPGAEADLAGFPADMPLLVFGWHAGATDAWLAAARSALPPRAGVVDVAVCTHAAGPPVCWCRPPLPGLWLAFARRHGIDPRLGVVESASPVHRRMAETLGLRVSSPAR